MPFSRSLWAIALITVLPVSAQWQQQSGVPAVDLYSVTAFDDQVINGAAAFSLLRSENDGATWDTTTVELFGAPFPCILYDVAFITPQIGVASGLMSLGSQFVMLRTTDGGATWATTYISTTGGPFREIHDIDFATTTLGCAVGLSGRLLRTGSGGTSWTAVSGLGSGHLYGSDVTSSDVWHVVGDGRILSGPNNGSSWTEQSVAADLRGVHFPSPLRGYAVGREGAFLRTDDGGDTWAPIGNAFGATDLTSVFFTSDDVGYVTGGDRIWHTTTGGLYWEYFACGAPMNDVSFRNGEGIAVGNGGMLLRTDGGTGGYAPVASFEVDPAVLCQDSVVHFTNGSAPGLSSTWSLNGVPFATTTDASLVIPGTQQLNTITLVVDNGSRTDTMEQSVVLAPPLTLAVHAVPVQDTLCTGASTQVQVPLSVAGASYRLRRHGVAIGAAQNGSGGLLTFNTGTITFDPPSLSSTDTLTLIGTRVVPGCGTAIDSIHVLIHCATPDGLLALEPVDPVVCHGAGTAIRVVGAEAGVSYQLRSGTVNVGAAVVGTGSDVLLPTGDLVMDSTYNVRATGPTGCIRALTQTTTVTVDDPHAMFTLPAWNMIAGQSVQINNTSTPAVTYAWTFGPGITPATSTQAAPTITLGAPTPQTTLSLTITSAEGCTATRTATLNILAPFDPGACILVQGFQVQGGSGFLTGLAHGPDDEVVFLMHNADSPRTLVFGLHGDTLAYVPQEAPNSYADHTHLIKMDASGVLQWKVDIAMEECNSGIGDVVLDTLGNSYAVIFNSTYTPNRDSVRIHSNDGRLVYYRSYAPGETSSYRPAMVASWDTHGVLRWYQRFTNDYGGSRLRLRLGPANDLYLVGYPFLQRYDRTSGAQLWQVNAPQASTFRELVLGPGGEPRLFNGNDLAVDQYTTAGTLDLSEQFGVEVPQDGYSARLRLYYAQPDDAGRTYVIGSIRGRWVLGPDTVASFPYVSDYANDLFIARIDPGQGIAWARQLHDTSEYAFEPTGFNVVGGHVLALLRGRAFTASLDGHPPVTEPEVASLLVHLDTAGGTPRLVEFPSPNSGEPGYMSTGRWQNGVSGSLDGGRVALTTRFSLPLQFGTLPILPTSVPAAANFLVTLGDADCMVPTLPSAIAVPVSYFLPPASTCAGDPVQFTDASLNGPATWSWQFEDAVPATSSDPWPTVVFNGPGEHAVTLTASNGNGPGTTYSSTYLVDVCTGIDAIGAVGARVFPTLADDRVEVIAPACRPGDRCRLLDLQGREVLSVALRPALTIDLSGYANGAYVLHIERGTSSEPHRIVVQH